MVTKNQEAFLVFGGLGIVLIIALYLLLSPNSFINFQKKKYICTTEIKKPAAIFDWSIGSVQCKKVGTCAFPSNNLIGNVEVRFITKTGTTSSYFNYGELIYTGGSDKKDIQLCLDEGVTSGLVELYVDGSQKVSKGFLVGG